MSIERNLNNSLCHVSYIHFPIYIDSTTLHDPSRGIIVLYSLILIVHAAAHIVEGLRFGLNSYLHSYFVSTNTEGSSQTNVSWKIRTVC